MNKNHFSYNTDLHRLELDGKALLEGDAIEIRILGHWLPGHVALDSLGWYLITPDLVGIRLFEGLAARRPQEALHGINTANRYGTEH